MLRAQYGNLGRLLVEAQTTPATIELDVLDEHNAERYWRADERHDQVISLNHGRAALTALARVIERWVAHLAGVTVAVEPLRRIEDERWAWHIGLDAEATRLLNALWRGEAVEPGDVARLLCLFRMTFADPACMRADLAGRPLYLALAMDAANIVRMKPQNLIVNLPLARAS